MERIYDMLVRWTIHRRKLLLSVIITLTLVLGFFVTRIEIRTNFKDLLGAGEEVMREYDKMGANYPYSSSVFIVLEGEKASELISVGDRLTARLRKDKEWVQDVQWREDMDFFRSHSLILQRSEDLKEMRKELKDHPDMFARVFTGFNLEDLLSGMNATFSDYDTQPSVKQNEDDLVRFMRYYQEFFTAVDEGVSGSASEFSIRRSLTDLLTDPEQDSIYRYIDDEGRMISPDGKLALMQVISTGDANEFDYAMRLIAHLREEIAEVESANSRVKIGLTGFPVLASDEAEAMMDNLALGFLVAIVGILLIFFIGFRQILMPVLAAVPLVIGVIWSMGIVTLTVGELNMFSMMAPIILLGLGIDYAIHIISKYAESRAAGMTMAEALTDVFQRIGRGLAVGAGTTAAAFFAVIAAGFKGMNDFGLIGGISVLGAFFSVTAILPLLLTALDRRWSKKGKVIAEVPFRFLGHSAESFVHLRYLVVGGLVVLVILAAFSVSGLQIEKDILKIEPKGLNSIRLQHAILDKFNFSIYTSYAMLDSLNELYQKAQQLEDKPTVKRTESLAAVFPNPEEQSTRREIIAEIASCLRDLSPITEKNANKETLLAELKGLKAHLLELKTLSYMGGLTRLVAAIEDVEGQADAVLESVQTANEADIRTVNDIIYSKLRLEYRSLKDGLNSLSIEREDVPSVYFDRFQGEDGSLLLTVYPSEYVWTAEFTDKHLAELNRILSNPTGMIPIWGQLLTKMLPGMLRATGAALGVLALLLFIDFRKLRRAVAILIPLVLSLFFTLALLPVFGMKLNIVSVMAFPLILGIGIDDAVHLYHRYLVERNIHRTFTSTGKAITMTTLTTIMAMMSLVLSSHPGMISFAWVASMGIALCLVLDLLILPVLIKAFEKEEEEEIR